MKKVLLASTALAGASLLATSANAGTPIVGDNQEVTISGNVRFSIHAAGQDVRNPGGGNNKGETRGYKFQTDESEVKFAARAAADNGLEFGLEIEILTEPGDAGGSDEAWIFLQFEGAGRVELGDQDGAADRILVDASDVAAGRGGFDGPPGTLFNFGSVARTGPGNNITGDATKVTYFTPRFGGFQAGASFTPDVNQTGGAAEPDNNNTYSNVVSLGANFQQTFNNVGVIISAVGEFGENEDTSAATGFEDAELWAVGANVTFGGFAIGAGYHDRRDTGITKVASAAGADAGSWFDVGASYTTGPWKIWAGYFRSENDQAGASKAEMDFGTVGVTYNVAPGLSVKTDLNYIDVKNGFTGTQTNNEGYTFVLSLEGAF